MREEGGGNAGRVGCGRAEAGAHGESRTGGKVEREAAKSKEARRISESDGPKKQHRGERERERTSPDPCLARGRGKEMQRWKPAHARSTGSPEREPRQPRGAGD